MNSIDFKEIETIALDLNTAMENSPTQEFQNKMSILLKHPETKIFLIKMLDVAFRSSSPKQTASYIYWLFGSTEEYKPLFTTAETFLLRLFQIHGRHFPSISIPLMLKQIQASTQSVVFFENESSFKNLISTRSKQGITVNVNVIGEAMIGETQAKRRLDHYIHLLNQDFIEYVSVKMSTLYSQIRPIAFTKNVEVLVDRLSILYKEVVQIQERTSVKKFINVDMEEYRDLHLNLAVFTQALEQPEFKNLRAGIVIQTYLPDSDNAISQLQDWASNRVDQGGSPVKVRLVKGANLEMEKTESSLRDWPLVTYATKHETDSNFKKQLLKLLCPESCKSLHVGVASHNIFDIAYALYLVQKYNLWNQVEFELLEGMAPEIVTQLRKRKARVVVYTPVVERKDYNAAIAYLVRRLDEGTQQGNFLKEGFGLKHPSDTWTMLFNQFQKSYDAISNIHHVPNRNQNRSSEVNQVVELQSKLQKGLSETLREFSNEPDTDWTLIQNRQWIKEGLTNWAKGIHPFPNTIPIVFTENSHQVGTANIHNHQDENLRDSVSITNYQGTTPWEYELANEQDIEDFIKAPVEWSKTTIQERFDLITKAAENLKKSRLDLIGSALIELGKSVEESDVEVSEAIDFANYYASQMKAINTEFTIQEKSGVNLVLSPWNFPIAIPLGGVFASLAVGKRVILKPSLNAAACSYVACQCLWDAGIPKDVLGFLPAHEDSYAKFLKTSCPFDVVILTGSTDTAKFLLKQNLKLPLFAETGGKNSTYIEALSDHEQAISHLMDSAFSNGGQKCSASSLLILQDELYNSKTFQQKLADAVASIQQGDTWKLENRWGVLSEPVNSRILKLLKETPDDQWLVKPVLIDDFTITPGVLMGVKPGDYFFRTEFFGPILGVIQVKNVKEAVDISNGVQYGLTAGIESLNPPSITYWKEHIQAGNLYVNRTTTGAIVRRQPFGGIKESCFGFGMKAGGPNYLLQFACIPSQTLALNRDEDLNVVFENYQKAYENEFSKARDVSLIRGQHNIFRYQKPSEVLLLISEQTSPIQIKMVKHACKLLDVAVVEVNLLLSQNEEVELNEFIGHLHPLTKVRSLLDEVPSNILNYCHSKAVHIYEGPPHHEGRLELLNYIEEQSISHDYHRYGNSMGIQPGEF